MNTIDLSPLYRNTIGFDNFASIINSAMSNKRDSGGYPPYNIMASDDNHYSITLAIAGFAEDELDIQVEKGVLTVRGEKQASTEQQTFLYQGIATRSFSRQFNLADYIEVTGAELNNGLLEILLAREIPEAMKPKKINIGVPAKSPSISHPHKKSNSPQEQLHIA